MKSKLIALILLCFPLGTAAQKHLGMDLSLLPKYEQHNKPYLDKDGKAINNMLTWLPTVGVNTVRVRLFVDPTKSDDIAVCQDLDYVKAFGKRIKAAGHRFMLDFHYSDTWADPVRQKLPASWADCTTAEMKAKRLYDYTKEVLNALNVAGATPDLVQVGNEITYGIVGISVHPYDNSSDDWTGFINVLTQGCNAVRETCPKAKIVIHTERSGNATQTTYFYNKLSALDYDVIGLSYYPFWHGSLNTLGETLARLGERFPAKEVQIVETAYNFQYSPGDVKYDSSATWSYTPEGQNMFIQDLVAKLNGFKNVTGIYYWFPEEAGNGDDTNWSSGGATVISDWTNRGLWKSQVEGIGHKCNPGLYSLQGFQPAAIRSVEADRANDALYNLKGQRITAAKNDEIVIKNGKKFTCK